MPDRPEARNARPTRFARALLLLAVLPFTACQDTTEPPVARTLEAVNPEPQAAAAGTRVGEAPVVRVLDQWSRPMPGVEVRFAIVQGGGELGTATSVTDADGLATARSWLLGPAAGPNRSKASVAGLDPVEFLAQGQAGDPARLEMLSGSDQTGVVARPLPEPVTVRVTDAFGNAVAGVVVRFVPDGDSDAVISSYSSTDANGLASATWTAGTRAGMQKLTVRAEGVGEVVLEAAVTPGDPAGFQIVEGGAEEAVAGSAVRTPPVVRLVDAWGNATPGREVTFQVVAGGGAIDVGGASGSSGLVRADVAGTARLTSWRLGTSAGINTVRAAAGSAIISIDAVGLPGSPASLVAHDGNAQSAMIGTSVPVPPAVKVVDAMGNGVPDVEVVFTVGAGGGSVSGGTTLSDASGVASPAAWVLVSPGTNTLIASASGLTDVTFTATGTLTSPGTGGGGGSGGSGGGGSGGGGGGFDLEVLFSGTVTPSQQSEFYAAAGRWASVITGDLPDVAVNIPANACGIQHPAVSGTIDDLVVLVSVVPIDGAGGILGSAGPCYVRSSGGLPVVGAVRIDEADLAYLQSNGRLGDVLAHEFGHVIGIGTRWGTWLVGGGTADPYFNGPLAVAEFIGAGGSTYPGTPVPIENTGGPGTRDGHWRESVFHNELMTGWLDLSANPLSTVTVGALQDIGYTVDFAYAEGFSVPTGAAAPAGTAGSAARIEMRESALPIQPIAVDARGRPAPLRMLRR